MKAPLLRVPVFFDANGETSLRQIGELTESAVKLENGIEEPLCLYWSKHGKQLSLLR